MFADLVFNGYGNAKKDFMKQVCVSCCFKYVTIVVCDLVTNVVLYVAFCFVTDIYCGTPV